MVERIEIRGFRGIGFGSVPLAPFTVLLGLNGGGTEGATPAGSRSASRSWSIRSAPRCG